LLEFCQTACELGINAAPLHWRVLNAVNDDDRFGLKDDGALLCGCFEQIANLDADLFADALAMMPSPPKKVHLRKQFRASLLLVAPWMVDRSSASET